MPDSIVIGAALAHRVGYGGHAWALLQYVLGFRELGFEVTVFDRLEPEMLGAASEEAALAYLRGLLGEDGISYCVLDAEGRKAVLAALPARRSAQAGQPR